MMKQFIAGILAISIFVSSVGLVKIEHFCAKVIEAVEAGDLLATCAKVSCCDTSKNSDKCCSSEVEYIYDQDQSDYTFSGFDYPSFADVDLDIVDFIDHSKTNKQYNYNTFPKTNKAPPPKQNKPIRIAFASFLC